ncbi:MAG TPA: hypothetical protein PKD12_02155 [Nitrospira sp.]|nr:hypothetical protein [Nitrospira sp.]
MDTLAGLLPGGYVDNCGEVQREIELRPLTGREEELLATSRPRESASLVTVLLSRCIQRLGAIRPVSEALVRNLLVADRQYLLLKLREATFGEQIRANVFCPWPECGQRVTINFSVKDIPIRESEDKGPVYMMTLSPEIAGVFGADERQITFRLPNGEDQESISPLLAENEALALARLFGRCIQRIGRLTNIDEEAVISQLSPAARLEIEQQMERIAPKVELTMDINCHECGRVFVAPFDLHRFFFGEMRTSGDLLYREVHYLAYHYHWSEREILEMTRDKRRRYIDVLADEIERLNNAV